MKGKLITLLVFLFLLSAPYVLAQNFCQGDFNYNGSVAAEDVTVFLEHFGRNPYHPNPCPPDGPSPVPQTGQTTSFATGDDGDLERGVFLVTPRFTDNGDGTVTDNFTGLIWLKDANCIASNCPGFDNDGTMGGGRVTWQHALDFVAGINDGTYPDCGAGSTDWRLPHANELASLVHKGYYLPALPNTAGTGQWSEGDPFTNVQ